MPIVHVHSILPADSSVIAEMLEGIRNKGASALKTPRDNVWVTYTPLLSYLGPSPIVTIKAQSGRAFAERSEFVEAVAGEVGRALSLPSQKIWIQYQEMSPKDVWFDGHWAEAGHSK